MFLDDKLLKMCVDYIDYNGLTSDKINEFNQNLYRECKNYYRRRIKEGISKSEAKIIIDRTFKLWDSFVRMALKHSDKKIQILGELFKKYTFKSQFLIDPVMSKLYNEL